MSDPQALEIEAAQNRKRIVNSIVENAELAGNFYSEWDAALSKDKGAVFSRADMPEGASDYTFLVPGDHIYYRGAFGIEMAEHHGLYVGGGWVVEAWINASVEGYRRALVTPEIHAGMVDARTLSDFTDGGSKVVYKREYIPPRSAEERREAVRRAIDSFGSRGYNLMRANCEHFVCEIVATPLAVPRSEQIDRYMDTPIVLGKICEEYIKELISKRDALIYIADAETYLRLARQSAPLNDTDLGIMRSMALRYGYASTPDGTPVRHATQQALLDMLRPAMLINMGRAAPEIASTIMAGLERMPSRAMQFANKRARP